jgi:(p)ppGpp synthase/HD superfamily hydrolase
MKYYDRAMSNPLLTADFLRALLDAEHYHRDQIRKSTDIPYIGHLLGVCSLVIEAGGTEVESIAALLHDAAEDAGGQPVLEAIRQNYGPVVARIVADCSDAFPEPGGEKEAWLLRKERYIDHLRGVNASTMLVSAADKLYNLRAIQSDHREIGDKVFERFSMPGDKRALTLWYYHSLYDVYVDPGSPPDSRRAKLTNELRPILDWFKAADVQPARS